jgi:hypothetical protein
MFLMQVPTGDQVKHDDLREASSAFVLELSNGKEFIADSKAAQVEALAVNIKAVKEELAALTAALGQGKFVQLHSRLLWRDAHCTLTKLQTDTSD